MKWKVEPVRIITSAQTFAIACVTGVAIVASWSPEASAATVGIVSAGAVLVGNLFGVRPHVAPWSGDK